MNTLEYTDERELTDAELETVTGGYHRHHHRYRRWEDFEDQSEDAPQVVLVPLINAPVTVG